MWYAQMYVCLVSPVINFRTEGAMQLFYERCGALCRLFWGFLLFGARMPFVSLAAAVVEQLFRSVVWLGGRGWPSRFSVVE